jgi:hypothetical protein
MFPQVKYEEDSIWLLLVRVSKCQEYCFTKTRFLSRIAVTFTKNESRLWEKRRYKFVNSSGKSRSAVGQHPKCFRPLPNRKDMILSERL